MLVILPYAVILKDFRGDWKIRQIVLVISPPEEKARLFRCREYVIDVDRTNAQVIILFIIHGKKWIGGSSHYYCSIVEPTMAWIVEPLTELTSTDCSSWGCLTRCLQS